MFTLKELNQLKTILDYSDFADDSEVGDLRLLNDKQANSITVKYLRDKICDLITLKKSWNKGERIKEDVCVWEE